MRGGSFSEVSFLVRTIVLLVRILGLATDLLLVLVFDRTTGLLTLGRGLITLILGLEFPAFFLLTKGFLILELLLGFDILTLPVLSLRVADLLLIAAGIDCLVLDVAGRIARITGALRLVAFLAELRDLVDVAGLLLIFAERETFALELDGRAVRIEGLLLLAGFLAELRELGDKALLDRLVEEELDRALGRRVLFDGDDTDDLLLLLGREEIEREDEDELFE